MTASVASLTLDQKCNWDEQRRLFAPMAKVHCTQCYGQGVTLPYGSRIKVCNCVWRTVFRCCLGKYKELDKRGIAIMRVHPKHGVTCSLPSAEFRADFELICRRTISRVSQDSQVFCHVWWFHMMVGMNWKTAIRYINHYNPTANMDRGKFFHAVYWVENKCGRALYETKPYGLFPTDLYLCGGKYISGSEIRRQHVSALNGSRRVPWLPQLNDTKPEPGIDYGTDTNGSENSSCLPAENRVTI